MRLVLLTIILVMGTFLVLENHFLAPTISEGQVAGTQESAFRDQWLDSLYPGLSRWQRRAGPPKVALQIGHLDNDQVPEELENIRGNTGAQAGGVTEVSVNQRVAQTIKTQLATYPIQVELLPAVIPPGYWADVFIAIHADGSDDPGANGFKVAGPWRDMTGRGDLLVQTLETEYQRQTGLPIDPNITRNMRGYYAFSWWRFEHAIHPMTTAAIFELGFITNPSDRAFLVENNDLVSQALVDGILTYLRQVDLL